ncbi:metalloendopeptidase [Coemansia sp. RSA 1722]|nr:metalloendopeptidase [Coemansia sp. RSA 1722]
MSVSASTSAASSVSAKETMLEFGFSAKDIEQTVQQYTAEANEVYNQVAAVSDPTFDTVVYPFAMVDNKQATMKNVIGLLACVSTDKDIRDACEEAEKTFSKHCIDVYTREDLYKGVLAVYENKAEMDKLCDEDKKLMKRLVDNFLDSGLGLSKEDRNALKEMNKRLSDLKVEFSQNISADKSKMLFTREELAGVAESFFEDRETQAEDGIEKYVVTTKYPDQIPVMEYAHSEETRQRLLLLSATRCPKNIELLQEAVILRRKAAKLLGYKNHAEFALKDKMAKTPETVMEFANDLLNKLSVLADQEAKEFETLKRADKAAAGQKYEGLFKWDYCYYDTKIIQNKHNVDQEALKQYFSVEKIVPGILNIYENMLGLHFIKVQNPPVWHTDVEMYEAWEDDKQTFVGHFYLDLYPRDDKYSHAAMFPIRYGDMKSDGTFNYPAATLVTNFPKPTSSAPALLTHENVTTLLHELGHVFHFICSRTRWSDFFGTNTQWDFVEAPSQMLENWAWEPSVLQKIAVHYKTGEPLPEDLMNNLIASSIRNKLSAFKPGSNKTWGAATFGHVMGGYDAGYYGYLWSKVFSADMFEARFKKEGLFNKQTGRDYRKEILLPGGSRDAMVSLEKFLGRKPQNSAFLKAIGLASSE